MLVRLGGKKILHGLNLQKSNGVPLVVCYLLFNLQAIIGLLLLCAHWSSVIIFRFVISVILDKPEEFLLQMHKMRHFAERLECWLFSDRFSESLLHIGESWLDLTKALNLTLS